MGLGRQTVLQQPADKLFPVPQPDFIVSGSCEEVNVLKYNVETKVLD